MRRLFWISVGVGATIYVLQKVNKVNAVTNHLTPAGISSAVNNLADSFRSLSTEFKASMEQHEEAITQALLAEHTPRATQRFGQSPESAWESDFAFDSDDPEQYF